MVSTFVKIGIGLALTITILGLIVDLLPVITFPSELSNALSWLAQSMVDFDFLVPTTTIWRLFTLFLMIESILLSINLFIFVYNFLHNSQKN